MFITYMEVELGVIIDKYPVECGVRLEEISKE